MRNTPHRVVNPPSLLDPVGFAHAVVAEAGRTIHLGGQTGHGPDGSLPHGLVAQFEAAAANVATVLAAAGAGPGHLVSLHVFTTDADAYRANLRELGGAYQRSLGRHYPAMALFEVAGLFDPAALVELVGVAVVPVSAP